MKENMTFRELMNLGSKDPPDPDVRARVIEVNRQITQLGRTPDEAMILTEPAIVPDTPIWNVKITVVMNLRAPDGNTAICKLGRALQSAGFETIDISPDYADAFEAEDGTEPDELPVRRS